MVDGLLANAQLHDSVRGAVSNGSGPDGGSPGGWGRYGGSPGRAAQGLIGMRLLDRGVPATGSHPARSRRAVYRITDPTWLSGTASSRP